jgi:hypothetical protein
VIPTINVNTSATHAHPNPADPAFCDVDCRPVLIPCPIPRSVTFEVVSGECTCGYKEDTVAAARAHTDPDGVLGNFRVRHADGCSNRTVKVSCSISGETWETSEAFDVENAGRRDGLFVGVAHEPDDVLRACRSRWALVKALVLGQHGCCAQHMPDGLREQRDAVFSALTDMARAEEATCDARDAVRKERGMQQSRRLEPELRESAIELGDYVERLIEQIEVMP